MLKIFAHQTSMIYAQYAHVRKVAYVKALRTEQPVNQQTFHDAIHAVALMLCNIYGSIDEVEYSNGNILKTISTALPSGGRIRYFPPLGKRKS